MAVDELGYKAVVDTAKVLFWIAVVACIIGAILFVLGFRHPAGEAPGKMGIGIILFIFGLWNALKYTAKSSPIIDKSKPGSVWIAINRAEQIDVSTTMGRAMLQNAILDLGKNPDSKHPDIKKHIDNLYVKLRMAK